MSSYKTRLGGIATVLCALSLGACNATDETGGPGSSFGETGQAGVREPGSDAELDFGTDWDDDWIHDLAKAGGTATGRPGSGPELGPVGDGPRSVARRSHWSVLLGSYTAQNHRQAAANMVQSCAQIDPRLARAHVHTTAKGSIVLYGVYEDSQSPDAQRDLAWIKGIKRRDRVVFPRAILNRVTIGPDPDRENPLALLSVRRRYANVNPLYTLQVAVWGDFDSGKLSQEEIRERGLAYARELRSNGHDAYFHYDDNTRLCMVTVGLFGDTAIDGQSGLLSPEVEAQLKKFPAHLVNGELLHEPVDTRRPHMGTQVQRPRLVLVPK